MSTDYGEPWKVVKEFGILVDKDGIGLCNSEACLRRAAACVNALAGKEDPAAFMERARITDGKFKYAVDKSIPLQAIAAGLGLGIGSNIFDAIPLVVSELKRLQKENAKLRTENATHNDALETIRREVKELVATNAEIDRLCAENKELREHRKGQTMSPLGYLLMIGNFMLAVDLSHEGDSFWIFNSLCAIVPLIQAIGNKETKR